MPTKTATKKVKKKLTLRQKGFVKDLIETKNGTVAAKRNYNVKSDNVARAIASENLTKPAVIEAIADAFPDDLLAKKHKQLLEASTLHKEYFDPELSDEEIREIVEASPHCKLLHIERFPVITKKVKGKIASQHQRDTLVYVRVPENFTQGTALRDAYKLKGAYPSGDPDKPTTPGNVTINVLNYTVNQNGNNGTV